jgi:hypothetical protein
MLAQSTSGQSCNGSLHLIMTSAALIKVQLDSSLHFCIAMEWETLAPRFH